MSKSNQYTTPTEVDEKIGAATKRIDLLLTGVIIVLAVGFITLLVTVFGFVIDAWRFKAATYEELKNQITVQNGKIDTLTSGLRLSDQQASTSEEKTSTGHP